MVRHRAQTGRGQGPVAAVHCLLESVVKDVKGTGDTSGIIDAAGYHQYHGGSSDRSSKLLCLFSTAWLSLGGKFLAI
jgi:hypothetical protein